MTTERSLVSLTDPISGQVLSYTGGPDCQDAGYWQAGRQGIRWPAVMGIPFLRASRSDLAMEASWMIERGDPIEALTVLLQDTDDFAPAVPSLEASRSVARSLLNGTPALSGREMMLALEYGAVTDYFALRGSVPTFFSGVGLFKAGHREDRPVVEVACGAGHFIYWMRSSDVEAIGVDAVFSKLCLAHHFLGVPGHHLICAEASGSAPLPISTDTPTTVFCHDAFYFFEHKADTLREFRRIAGKDGAVLIGHAHLADVDHGAVAGFPLSFEEYRELTAEPSQFFDDAALARCGVYGGKPDTRISEGAEAVAFIEGAMARPAKPGVWPGGEPLHMPLASRWDAVSTSTVMDWPSEAFATEYADADYLYTSDNPSLSLPCFGDTHEPPVHPGLALPAAFLRLGCRPLRWGVIGGGWIAADYFAPAFQWLPHADLVALAEPHPGRRTAFKAIAPVETYDHWQAMLDHCSLDAVYIATPNDTHAELIEALAGRGIRVLCEKPLATNRDDLTRIQHAAEASPERFQTAFDQRYHPAHGHMAERINRGDCGVITQVHIHYACWVDDDWSKATDTENWRINARRAGGGAGFDLLPHCLDLIQMLLNDSIDTMHLLYQHRAHGYALDDDGVDDGALVCLRTRGGVLVSVSVGYNCPEDQPRRSITIIGTKGRIESSNTMGQDPGGHLQLQRNGRVEKMAFPDNILSGPFLRQIDAVSRLWMHDREPTFPFTADLDLTAELIEQDSKAKPPEARA